MKIQSLIGRLAGFALLINLAGFAQVPSEPAAPAKKMSESELAKELDTMLDRRLADDSFSGAVLIAKDGSPVYQRALGLANRQDKTPNRIDTKFNLGSINKIFTHLAIGQLIEAGKISLDDTIGKHLPDYPNRQAAEKVTIEHLIKMQSGIGDFFGQKYEAMPKNRLRTINDYLALFADQPLLFEPGSSRRYSNGGYIVLGAIIEKVTGQTYYDYVREHLFRPAEMSETDSYEADAIVPNLATGYTRRSDQGAVLVSNIYTRPARGSSAGGGYSTVDDLLRFSLALTRNKFLSPEFTRWVMGGEKPTRNSGTGKPASSQPSRGRGGIGWAGGAPGINAALELDLDRGYTVIVLSNLDPPSAENVAEQIMKSIR